jgi:hypothetical protein
MPTLLTDRRNATRDPLFFTRRRFPRLPVACDVFYESEESTWMADEADLSLRGVFLPCRRPDPEGTRGVVRLDLGGEMLVRLEVEVVRQRADGRIGMALRIVAMSDTDRTRLAAWLLREGGLATLPQLDRAFGTVTRAPRPRATMLAA